VRVEGLGLLSEVRWVMGSAWMDRYESGSGRRVGEYLWCLAVGTC
jgi:hypothetical protein